MARVLVVGSGLAGLGAALESAIRGHQVVILEKRKQLGGKATSTDFDGIPVGFVLIYSSKTDHCINYVKN